MARTTNRRATKTTARKPAPAKPKTDPKIRAYATKKPTDMHKAHATWITEEVGFSPEDMPNKRAAFLMGLSLGTVTRPAFQGSEWLEEWREENGVTKRGRKRADEVDDVDEEELDESEEDEDEAEGTDLDALEEELNTLQIGKLRAAAKEYGVTLKAGMKKDQIIAAILESVAEEEESADDEEGDDEELDLEALEAEMDSMELPDLKEFIKEEFPEFEIKLRERKGPLVQRVIDWLSEDIDEDEDDEPEEEASKSRGRKPAASKKSSKAEEEDDDFIF